MHCPNCGTTAVKLQKFCRACGFGLEQVAQLLDEAGHALPDSSAPDNSDERARVVEQWRDIAFYIFAATIVTGLAAILGYGIIYKMMIVKGNVIPGFAVAALFLRRGCTNNSSDCLLA